MTTTQIPCPGTPDTHSQLYQDVFASTRTFIGTLTTPDDQFAKEMLAQLTVCATHFCDALATQGMTELPPLDLVEHKLFHELVEHLEKAAAFMFVLALIGECTELEAQRSVQRLAHMQHLLAERCALRRSDLPVV